MVFTALHRHAGQYVSDHLKISVISYGEMHGGRITWEWPNQLVDSGSVGRDGGRVYLALLTNSQPWWGFGFLRMLQLRAFSTGDTTRLQFVWPDSVSTTEEETLTLAFSTTGMLTVQMTIANDISRCWDLTRISTTAQL